MEQDDVRVPVVVAWQERAWILATLQEGDYVRFHNVIIKNKDVYGTEICLEAYSNFTKLPTPPNQQNASPDAVVAPPIVTISSEAPIAEANDTERLFAL